MHRFTFVTAVVVASLVPIAAHAQKQLAYDTVTMETPAAVSCGFCAGEKFGVMYYALPSGGGLLPSDFPLMLRAVKLAMASARVTCDDTGLCLTQTCGGSTMGATLPIQLSIFAGPTVPTAIASMPASGPWAGETEVMSMSLDVMLSVETTAGSSMYSLMINELRLGEPISVAAPNTYLRVVVDIPSGSASDYCVAYGFGNSGAYPLRDDDGRIGDRRNFIYAVGGALSSPGWYWNEEENVMVAGDWVLRLEITPASMPPTDGGVPGGDGGAGDGGGGDGGGTGAMCTTDAECAGGERCQGGRCMRVTCTIASECGGGMTCVDMRCRSLCDSNADCAGGEVCDTAAGYCTPVGTGGGGSDGGCCGVAGARTGDGALAATAAALAIAAVFARRRRRR